LILLAGITAGLLACNALIGVEDVSPLAGDGGKRPRTDADQGGADADFTDPDSAIIEDDTDRSIVALGFLHGCGRRPNGSVRCWGANIEGELGAGPDATEAFGEATTPADVPGITDAVSIGAGNAHTCIVRKTGTVSCWGRNDEGQLGNGTLEDSYVPANVQTISNAKRVVGGQYFTCALLADRTVSCWGKNESGQLGDDTHVDRPLPAPVKQLTNVLSLSAGDEHVCAVLTNHTVTCWGKNATGQLGIGTTTDAPLPTALSALTDVAQVAGSSGFSCARLRTGRVYCWGDNAEGQLGNGSPNPSPNPSPISVPSLGDAVWLWAGFQHACAVRKGGDVVCWGRGAEGQLGIETLPDGAVITPVPTPTRVVGIPASEIVFTGGDRACALTAGGSGMCWGSNAWGQLANGTVVTPARKATKMVNWP
jgi:alpha-tubulin suppressor-like RCC1 family protein